MPFIKLPTQEKLQTVSSAGNLVQAISQPTSVVTKSTLIKSSRCIDHIFTVAAEICFKAVSKSIGCRKTKVPKAGPNIMYKKSYKKFCNESYVVDVKNICWSVVCNEEQPDAALDTFMKLLIPVTNKCTPIQKMTVKNCRIPMD